MFDFRYVSKEISQIWPTSPSRTSNFDMLPAQLVFLPMFINTEWIYSALMKMLLAKLIHLY